jgi:hypothetical protein
LKAALTARYAEREIPLHIHTPRNCETVELHFRGEKTAKVVGNLAMEAPEDGTLIEGALASKDFTFQIIAPSQVQEFTELVCFKLLIQGNRSNFAKDFHFLPCPSWSHQMASGTNVWCYQGPRFG